MRISVNWFLISIYSCALVSVIVDCRPTAPLTKITTVLELFNPISLVKFFEFHDQGWIISGECIRDMFWYLEAIEQDYLWPIKLNDATGRYGGGLLAGNQQRLVDRGLCDELNKETVEFYSHIQENISNVSKIVPYPVQTVVVKYQAKMLERDHTIHYSVCFSRACSEKELWHIFEYNPVLGFSSAAVGNVSLIDVRVLKDTWTIELTSPNILYLLLSISLFLGIILYAGVMESWGQSKTTPSRRRKVINSNEVLFFDVILSFFSSFAPRRLLRELQVDYGSSKPALHEFRVLCVFIITLSQSIRMFLVVSGSAFPQRYPILWAWSKESSSYSWDLIYFLVGFCLAFHINGLLKMLSSHLSEDAQMHVPNCNHVAVVFIVQLTRIILPYVIIICLAQMLGIIVNEWSVLDVPSVDHEFCAKSGWKNLLFLDQFLPITKRCAPWTWFISVEFHCSALVLLLIMLTRRTPNFGMIISSSFFICSILLSIFLDNRPGHGGARKVHLLLEEEIRAFNNVHRTPWIFIGPFLIGKYTGELCFQTKCKPRLGETLRILGWILAFLVFAIIVSGRIAFGLFEDFKSVNVGFEGVSHSLFCIIASWIVINKTLSSICWKWTRPLSKLSTSCLLVHPLVLRLFVIVLGSNTLQEPNWFVVIVVHFGLISCSLVISSILFVVFEAPFSVFKRRYVQKFILRQY